MYECYEIVPTYSMLVLFYSKVGVTSINFSLIYFSSTNIEQMLHVNPCTFIQSRINFDLQEDCATFFSDYLERIV